MTTGIKNWSTTPGSNNSTSPNGAPEGMAPSQVNDVIRQNMAEVRAWYEDASWIDFGHTLTYVDTGTFRISGNVTDIYHVGRRVRAIGTTPFTIYGTISASAYDSTNTDVDVTWDSGSLNNTLGEVAVGPEITNKPIHYNSIKVPSTGIPTSDIQGGVNSIGDYKTSLQTADHGKWLLCDGSAVSRTTYASLFALMGTAFGSGDGSTTFNLPTPYGRSPVFAGQGTTGEGDVTGTDRSIGDEGGYETHTLTETEIASHTHDIAAAVTSGSGDEKVQGVYRGVQTDTVVSDATGGDGAHNNMHPFIVLGNLFVYSGV